MRRAWRKVRKFVKGLFEPCPDCIDAYDAGWGGQGG